MKKIIVIFDSSKESKLEISSPITPDADQDYDIELWDISSKIHKVKKKANSLLYQYGTTNTPLYLFENDDEIYNSHYFEHGPLIREVALRKLNNE